MRIRLLLFFLILLCPGPVTAQEEGWRFLAPGLHFRQMEASTASGSGSPNLFILRISPDFYRFQILYSPPQQKSASDWQAESGATVVCNIGQYDKNFNYLGLLVKNGFIYSRLAPNQQGLFLAEPSIAGLAEARILDLRYSAFNEEQNPYTQAAQSLMLVDRYRQVRVRRSDKTAHRSLLGQDEQGNIVIIISEGRHTLRELADFLAAVPWLREIMCMDGGAEAQLVIKTDNYYFESYGMPQILPDMPWPASQLPMALAVFPR
jgi:uncharacterized protein YigE (DUF2233 family)